MKKTLLSLAVAAGMVASSTAFAAPSVYGNLHLSILQFDKDDGTGHGTNGNLLTSSNTSSFGIKGSDDLGDGMKAFYKAEFQFDAANAAAPTGRDQYVGLKGGMGKITFGSMTSNYKQKGGSVDSLYRTPAEGRGFIKTQSNLHGGAGTNRGRMTNAMQFSSNPMGGMQIVANTTFSDSDDETVGLGFRYAAKSFSVYADMIDTAPQTAAPANPTETATKLGAKFSGKSFFVGGQFESTEDVVGYNYVHLNGGYLIDNNNIVTATFGNASHIDDSTQDTAGLALAYDHKMSKATDVYVAYVSRTSDTESKEDSAMAAGIRVKFK